MNWNIARDVDTKPLGQLFGTLRAIHRPSCFVHYAAFLVMTQTCG